MDQRLAQHLDRKGEWPSIWTVEDKVRQNPNRMINGDGGRGESRDRQLDSEYSQTSI